MAKRKSRARPKLPEDVKVALVEKIKILEDLRAIKHEDKDSVKEYFEKAIFAEPTRDPFVIMDQIARSYIDKLYK